MNRRQLMLGSLVPATGAMGLLASVTPPALAKKKRRKKYKVVTRTYKNPTSITILDDSVASLYPSPIKVKGLKRGKILDVNLTLHGFSHATPKDLNVLLVAPDGTSALLMCDAGAVFEVDDLKLTLDDQAPGFMHQFNKLTSGAYKPTIYGPVELVPLPAPGSITGTRLSVFRHRQPNGPWKLYIHDPDLNVESGAISGGWSLRIRARVKK